MLTIKARLASCLIAILFFGFTGTDSHREANRIVGIWESVEKNLQIEMVEEEGHFAGKMIWFLCSSGESMMFSYRDTENPDPKLTTRPLIGLNVVEKIYYQGNNIWGDGKIYDPNTGHTFDARITLIESNTAVVRGYWKFRWIGRSIVFHRL
jgi:uncharacterized protein (DUF2147 family)